MTKYLKNRSILIGSSFILMLLLFSFIYSFFLKDTIKSPPTFLYNHNGKLIDTYPFPPSLNYPFGVDRIGRDVFWLVIDGAKYTVLFAMLIGIARVFFGLFFGIIYGVFLHKVRFLFEAFERAFRFVPSALLVILFFSVDFFHLNDYNTSMLLSQFILLIVVGLPPVISVIGNEVTSFIKNEFIISTKILGGNNRWIIRKHIIPFLKTRLLLMFVQQIIQVLFLLIHLGVFKIIVGGGFVVDMGYKLATFSASNEWSGLIGLSYAELMLDQWIVIGPSIGFILTILAFTAIKKGIENSPNSLEIRKTRKKKEGKEATKIIRNSKMDFTFVNK